jgi:hypothetical protein
MTKEKDSKDKLFIAGAIALIYSCFICPYTSMWAISGVYGLMYAVFSMYVLWLPIYIIGLILVWFSRQKVIAKVAYTLLSAFLMLIALVLVIMVIPSYA